MEHRPFELVSVDFSIAYLYFVGKDALVRLSEHDRFLCTEVIGIVEVADKHEVRDLLNDIQRVDKSARRKYVPKSVNSIFQFACDHCLTPFLTFGN